MVGLNSYLVLARERRKGKMDESKKSEVRSVECRRRMTKRKERRRELTLLLWNGDGDSCRRNEGSSRRKGRKDRRQNSIVDSDRT